MNSPDVHLRASSCGRASLLQLSILLVLMPLPIGASSDKKICNPMVDIVIAVDTSSSCTDAEFQRLLSKVNDIASKFEIDQFKNQLALIGMSDSPQLVANFSDVRSQADFSSAVGKLKRTTNKSVDMTLGLKLARESAFTSDRGRPASKLLILVKDRQCSSIGAGDAHGADYFASIGREAAALRQMACAIHAVGVGGLWNTAETKALFGTEYLLFQNQSKAIEYAASMNKQVCRADCGSIGESTIKGTCFNSARHVLTVRAQLTADLTSCIKGIVRSFEYCPVKESCAMSDRSVGPCASDGKAAVERKMQMFNRNTQTCDSIHHEERVQCDEANECQSQAADVIFVLAQTKSISNRWFKLVEPVIEIVKALRIGPNHVRIGLACYYNRVIYWPLVFGAQSNKDAIVSALKMLDNPEYFGYASSGIAFRAAKQVFEANSRPGARRVLIYFSDRETKDIADTYRAAAELKSIGVTIYAVGVKPVYTIYPPDELYMLAAPEAAMNRFFFNNIDDLKPWAVKFSMRLCDELSPVDPRFCDANVQLQSIVPCYREVEDIQIARVQYEFDSSGLCVKRINSTLVKPCTDAACTDPIDGKQYRDGESWTNFCHEFRCNGEVIVLPHPTTKCLAADLSCKPIGSPPFQCRGLDGSLKDNCRCVSHEDGSAALVIEY